MTPLQFAKAECSNYNQDSGACRGININNDGSMSSFRSKPKCVLAQSGIRCVFFEECVAPMATKTEISLLRHEYSEALTEYRLTSNVPKSVDRTCVCGRELEPRKRLCYVCRKTARKSSTRRAVAKTRNSGESDVSS